MEFSTDIIAAILIGLGWALVLVWIEYSRSKKE
jgi:hypothetical protein